jgi:hypothetical protein
MQVRIISKPSFIMPIKKKKASEYFSKARTQYLLGTESYADLKSGTKAI